MAKKKVTQEESVKNILKQKEGMFKEYFKPGLDSELLKKIRDRYDRTISTKDKKSIAHLPAAYRNARTFLTVLDTAFYFRVLLVHTRTLTMGHGLLLPCCDYWQIILAVPSL